MSAPITRVPATPKGARLREWCIETHGSIRAAAKAAGVTNEALRRRIYEVVTVVNSEINGALVRAGYPKDDLPP